MAIHPHLPSTSGNSRKRKVSSHGATTGSNGTAYGQNAKRRKLSCEQGECEQMARRKRSTDTRKHKQNAEFGKFCNIKPYSHSLVLPRASIFYQRNIRQRLPKTATLSTASAGQRGSVQLYREILLQSVHKTPLSTDIHIILPDLGPASQSGHRDHLSDHSQTGPDDDGHTTTVASHTNSNNQDGHNSSQVHVNMHHGNVKTRCNIKHVQDNTYTKLHPSFEKALCNKVDSVNCAGANLGSLSNNSNDVKPATLVNDPSFMKGHASFWESSDQDKYAIHCCHQLDNTDIGVKHPETSVSWTPEFVNTRRITRHSLFASVGNGSLSTEMPRQIPCCQVALERPSNVSDSSREKTHFGISESTNNRGNQGVLYFRRLSIIQQRQAGLNRQTISVSPLPRWSNTMCDVASLQYGSLPPPDLQTDLELFHDADSTPVNIPDTTATSHPAFVNHEDTADESNNGYYGTNTPNDTPGTTATTRTACVSHENKIEKFSDTNTAMDTSNTSLVSHENETEKSSNINTAMDTSNTSQASHGDKTENSSTINTVMETPDTATTSQAAYVSPEYIAVEIAAPLSEAVTVKPPTVTVPLLTELLAFLQNLIQRHRICPYKGLLKYYCRPKSLGKHPITKAQTCLMAARTCVFTRLKDRKKKPSVSMATLLTDHVHHRDVYLFLRATIRRTLPPELLGSAHNRNIVLRNISKLVSMGKFDKLCLGELMVGMKTTDCSWLQQLPSNNLKLHILAKVVHWIFTAYIFTLLQTYFYITETTFLRYKLLYYRQPVWQQLHTLGLHNLLQKKIMKPISEASMRRLVSGAALGVSTLRFLPKPRSLRPIVNMGTTAATPHKKLSVNKLLLDIHQILSYIKEQHPASVGYGQFGTDDVCRAWRQYGKTWRGLGQPALYFVKTDVTDCYNSILQHRLYNTLEDIIDNGEEDEYVIRKFVSVMATRGRLKRSFHRQAKPFSAYMPDFTNFARDWIDRNGRHDIVLVDKVVNQHESKASILEVLKAHLFTNIIKVGSNHYVQTSGISQGSVISTLLCSFYYSTMERRMFHVDNSDLLLRIVDDYLLVTPSHQRALAFLQQMIHGIPEYNCQTNVNKVLTNFTVHSQMPGIPNIGDEEWFPWCGMCFNTRTLEVSADYTRYQAVGIRDTVTIDLTNKPGVTLKNKLLRFAQPKCHEIFLDRAINSVEQVCRNCYQLFLLAAFKFHTIVRRLPYKQRVGCNTRYLMDVIQALGSFVHHQTSRINHGTEVQRCNKTEIDRDIIRLLCLRAFHLKLGLHRSLYMDLVLCLGRRVRTVTGRLGAGDTARIQALCGTTLPPGFNQLLN